MRGRARSRSTGDIGSRHVFAARPVPRLYVHVQLRDAQVGGRRAPPAGCRRSSWRTSGRKPPAEQERVQGHLNAMAMRLGELQARVLRLDGLGERLAKTAGLKPQELPSFQAGTTPGRGGAASSLPSRNLSVPEFSDLLEKLARQIDARTDQFGGARGAADAGFGQPQVPAVANIRSTTAGIRRTSATGSIRSPASSRCTKESISRLRRARRSSPRRAARSSSRTGIPSMVKWSRSITATA